MKKFKFIFFFSLILLGTCFYYFSISDYFKIKIVDDVYSKSNMEEVKVASVIKDMGMTSEEDITTNIVNDSNSISFTGTNLSINNPKTTLNLKLTNSYLDKKIDSEVECFTSSSYIDIYTDKNNYVIDRNSSIDVVITIELNNNRFYRDEVINYNCKIISSIL